MIPEDEAFELVMESENAMNEFFKNLYLEEKTRKIRLRERHSKKNAEQPQITVPKCPKKGLIFVGVSTEKC